MAGHARVRGIYGGPAAKKLDIPVTPELLDQLGTCLVAAFVKEAKKDFAKRGWKGTTQDGSPPIWESFSFHILGESTIEVMSTYPGIEELTSRGGVPLRKMTWLTQEAKNSKPSKYALTKTERRRGFRRGGRVRRGERLPLVVPVKDRGGKVVFRTAPLQTANAWVHPGIARFTFVERAVRAGKAACIEVIKREAVKALVGNFTT